MLSPLLLFELNTCIVTFFDEDLKLSIFIRPTVPGKKNTLLPLLSTAKFSSTSNNLVKTRGIWTLNHLNC